MTTQEFEQGLHGDIARTKDRSSRLCNLVADGLRERAKERQAEGRRDIASKLRYLAGVLDAHRRPTKKMLSGLSKDFAAVHDRLVDDVPIADWDSAR